jgi:hypothetical protein
MATIIERNTRPPGERVEVEGDPVDAVRSLTARSTQIVQEG